MKEMHWNVGSSRAICRREILSTLNYLMLRMTENYGDKSLTDFTAHTNHNTHLIRSSSCMKLLER